MLKRFKQCLEEYFESGQLQENRIPNIEKIAEQLPVLQRYLSET